MTPRLALDTNILSALLTKEPQALALARQLVGLREQHTLVIPQPVYAELLARPEATPELLAEFFGTVQVQKLPVPGEAVWERAGRVFGEYALRRRRSGGDWPRRILADFVIGAQLEGLGVPIFTADPVHYRAAFPGLAVITP